MATCNITFEPANSKIFTVEEQATAFLNYTILCLTNATRCMTIVIEDATIVDVSPTRWCEGLIEAGLTYFYEVNVTGLAFGRTSLEFKLQDYGKGNNGSLIGNDGSWIDTNGSWMDTNGSMIGNNGSQMENNGIESSSWMETTDTKIKSALLSSYEITVFRKATAINLVFQIVLGVMILLYNFGFGCIVDHEQIRDIIRRPVAPAIGAACQFLVMAPLSFGIAVALKLNSMTGLGLLAIGCSPGGGGSNVFAYLLSADLELSITLTFISTILALGMTPFWMWLLGRYFYDENTRLHIPVANVFASLAIVVLPVSLGVLVRHCRRPLADKFAWALKPFTAVIGVTFIGLGIYVYYYALVRVTWRLLVACVIVSFSGYVIGYVAGIMGKQPRKRAATISLETGFQNLALALFMLNTALEPPESDFAGVVPICYSFISAAFPSIAFIIMYSVKGIRKLRGTHHSEELVTGEEKDERDRETYEQSISTINNSLDPFS